MTRKRCPHTTPDIVNGTGRQSFASDIFSLGWIVQAVLYLLHTATARSIEVATVAICDDPDKRPSLKKMFAVLQIWLRAHSHDFATDCSPPFRLMYVVNCFNALLNFSIHAYIKLNANHFRYKFCTTRSSDSIFVYKRSLVLSLFSSK